MGGIFPLDLCHSRLLWRIIHEQSRRLGETDNEDLLALRYSFMWMTHVRDISTTNCVHRPKHRKRQVRPEYFRRGPPISKNFQQMSGYSVWLGSGEPSGHPLPLCAWLSLPTSHGRKRPLLLWWWMNATTSSPLRRRLLRATLVHTQRDVQKKITTTASG